MAQGFHKIHRLENDKQSTLEYILNFDFLLVSLFELFVNLIEILRRVFRLV